MYIRLGPSLLMHDGACTMEQSMTILDAVRQGLVERDTGSFSSGGGGVAGGHLAQEHAPRGGGKRALLTVCCKACKTP